MSKLMMVLLMSFIVNSAIAQATIPLGRTDDTAQAKNDASPKMNNKMIMDQLNLTKQQRAAIKLINQNHKTEKEAIENNDSLSAAQKKLQLKELRKNTEKNINSVLTDEQRIKRNQLKQQLKQEKLNDPQKSTPEEEDPGFENNPQKTN